MPDFRHPAEWQQAASRHTPLVDPVLTVRPIGRFDSLSRKPAARADSALVLTGANGSYEVFLPPRRPSRAELAGRNNQSLYEVDLGIHHLALSERLPTSEDFGFFQAAVDVDWRVTAADRVISSGLRDVPALIGPRIRQRMRAASREFPAELTGRAEQAVQDALETTAIAEAEGLYVTCTVRLELDETARAHKDDLRRYRYAHEAHPLSLQRVREESELMAAKADFYRYYLEQGGVTAWALQLAEHPDDLPKAIEHLRADQQEQVRSQIHLVEQLLEKGHIEQFQLDAPIAAALEAVTQLVRRPADPPSPPSLPQLDAAPEYPNDYPKQS